MTDIVERLRSKSTDCHQSEEALYLEAAEHIERLRAAAKAVVEHFDHGYYCIGERSLDEAMNGLRAAIAPEQSAECDHIWRAADPDKGRCIRCGEVRAPGQSAKGE